MFNRYTSDMFDTFDNSGSWGQYIAIDDPYINISSINRNKHIFGTHQNYINKCPTILENDMLYDDFVRIHSSESLPPSREYILRYNEFVTHPVFTIGSFVLSCVKKIWS